MMVSYRYLRSEYNQVDCVKYISLTSRANLLSLRVHLLAPLVGTINQRSVGRISSTWKVTMDDNVQALLKPWPFVINSHYAATLASGLSAHMCLEWVTMFYALGSPLLT